MIDFLSLFFPKKCLSCGKSGGYVCKECISKVKFASNICPLCRYFSALGKTHPSCKIFTPLDGLLVIWKFDGVIRKAIHAIKYRFAYSVSEELAPIIAKVVVERFSSSFDSNWMLVPIPLHKKRENWRGFNQSDLLGVGVAKALGCKFDSNILVRSVATKPQVEQGKKERLRSIRGIFAVNKKKISRYKDTKIIVFDDVWTTGSTISEATKVLKKAGAREVWGMAVAR